MADVSVNELVKFYAGVQEEYDALRAQDILQPNYLYFITDTNRVYKGTDLVSGDVDVYYTKSTFTDAVGLANEDIPADYDLKILVSKYEDEPNNPTSYFFNSAKNHDGSYWEGDKYQAWVRDSSDDKLHPLITPTSRADAKIRTERTVVDQPIKTRKDNPQDPSADGLILTSRGGVTPSGSTYGALYTDFERNKLRSIAWDAEVNVQSDWTNLVVNNDAYIKNKPIIRDSFTDATAKDATYTKDLATYSAIETEFGYYVRVNTPDRLKTVYDDMMTLNDWAYFTKDNETEFSHLKTWYQSHIASSLIGNNYNPLSPLKDVYTIKGPGTSGDAYVGEVTLTRADLTIDHVTNMQQMYGVYTTVSNPDGTVPSGATPLVNNFVKFADNTGLNVTDSDWDINRFDTRFEGGTGSTNAGTTYTYPGKVDKVEGYGLSKNDFTDELKAELDNLWERLPLDKSTTATTDRNTLYTLPVATSLDLGGIKIGTDLNIQDSVVNLATQPNINAGTYGNSASTLTHESPINIPQVTISSKGIITNVSNQAISLDVFSGVTAGTKATNLSNGTKLLILDGSNILTITLSELAEWIQDYSRPGTNTELVKKSELISYVDTNAIRRNTNTTVTTGSVVTFSKNTNT